MITSEVQRTLVKSPPELWTELSDPQALARHLGELGEVEIVRTEPEQLVEWKTADAIGVVRIKPSGWGTKVTLSVSKELREPAEAITEPEPTATEPIGHEDADAPSEAAEPDSEEPDPEPLAEIVPDEPTIPEPDPEQEQVTQTFAAQDSPDTTEVEDEPELQQATPVPSPRRGFFARLFGRRPKPEPEASEGPSWESEIVVPTSEAQHAEPEPDPNEIARIDAEEPSVENTASEHLGEEFDQPQADADNDEEPVPAIDIAAELKAAEEVAEEEVRAVLTAVLDRLGAAHHRPFSRA